MTKMRDDVSRQDARIGELQMAVAKRHVADPADDQSDGHHDQQAQLAPSQARADANAVHCPNGGSHAVSVLGPVESHAHLPDLDLVPVAQRPETLDALAVEPRPVGAAAIFDVPGTAAEREQSVFGRDERIVNNDRIVHVAAQGIDSVQGN